MLQSLDSSLAPHGSLLAHAAGWKETLLRLLRNIRLTPHVSTVFTECPITINMACSSYKLIHTLATIIAHPIVQIFSNSERSERCCVHVSAIASPHECQAARLQRSTIDCIDYATGIGNLHMRSTGTHCYGYRPSNG